MKFRIRFNGLFCLKILLGMTIIGSLIAYFWLEHFFINFSSSTSPSNFLPPPLSNPDFFSEKDLKKLAESITVRIFDENVSEPRGGSGVLISRRGNDYIVVTNYHVVSEQKLNYQLETPDGKFYPVKIISSPNTDLIADDLALVQFTTENQYQVISVIINPQINIGQNIFAVGFPFKDDFNQSRQLEFTKGSVSMILNRPLIGGYQLGYTNKVFNGMSGGAILNQKGELVGLNGLGKYPVIGDPYVFKDGTTVSDQEWGKMSHLSWAIPPKYIVNFIHKYLR